MPLTQSVPLRVLVVEDDTLVGMGLKATLARLGHHVTAHVSTPAEALASVAGDPPDLVLLDLRLEPSPDADAAGLTLAGDLAGRVPVIVITAYSDPDLIRRASAAPGVFAYLVKPVTPETLAAQIEVALSRAHDHEALLAENATLARTLETRKLADRAKAILMQKLRLSEPEAHRRLQLESQRRRIPLKDLAQKVIELNDLPNP